VKRIVSTVSSISRIETSNSADFRLQSAELSQKVAAGSLWSPLVNHAVHYQSTSQGCSKSSITCWSCSSRESSCASWSAFPDNGPVVLDILFHFWRFVPFAGILIVVAVRLARYFTIVGAWSFASQSTVARSLRNCQFGRSCQFHCKFGRRTGDCLEKQDIIHTRYRTCRNDQSVSSNNLSRVG